MLRVVIGAALTGAAKTYQSLVQMVRLNTSSAQWDTPVSGFPKKTMLLKMQKMIAEDLVQDLVHFLAVVRNRGK